MTKDMKLSELADELERLVSARNEPARLMRADHPQALQVAVATSNRIDRSLAEFVESNLPAILTALRDSTDRDAVLEEAARVVANKVAEGVFIQTRHACALRVEHARELVQQSSLQRDYTDIAAHIDGIFDGLSMMICEVLRDPVWTEEALATLTAERRLISRAALTTPAPAVSTDETDLADEFERLLNKRADRSVTGGRVHDALTHFVEKHRGAILSRLRGEG